MPNRWPGRSSPSAPTPDARPSPTYPTWRSGPLANERLRLAGAEPVDLKKKLLDGSALRKFAELIQAQSGDPRVVDDPSRLPTAPVRLVVNAGAAGSIATIDALEIALAGKSLGAGRDRKDAPIDLAVGVVLHKKVGDSVRVGEPLATIHARTQA